MSFSLAALCGSPSTACLLPTGPQLGGADRVSMLTRTWQLGRETGRQHTGPGAYSGSLEEESSLFQAAHSSFVPHGVGILSCLLLLHKFPNTVVFRVYGSYHSILVNCSHSRYTDFSQGEWLFDILYIYYSSSTVVILLDPLQFLSICNPLMEYFLQCFILGSQ